MEWNDKQKAKNIKRDLEKRWPEAKFNVVVHGLDVTVYHTGGRNYIDELPTYEKSVLEMTQIIRKTIPNFTPTDYETQEGKTQLV